MADIGIFPRLVGQGWPVKKTWTWQTRIQRAVSGRELRLLDYPFPLCQFELTFEALGQGIANGTLKPSDLDSLRGFVGACQGAFKTFLYDDPTDNYAFGQFIGTGDGTTTAFQLQRQVQGLIGPGEGFVDQVVAPKTVDNVYFSGTRIGIGNADAATGVVTFGAPPPPGTPITADFGFYFRCRFMSDAYSFENFMFGLWSLKKLDFITVRP